MAKREKKSIAAALGGFLDELQRRKVVQTTTVYLVAAWGLSAGAADIFGALGLPEWSARYAVIGIFALTPLVAVISWLYDINKKGIQRDPGPPNDQALCDTALARRDGRAPLSLRYEDRAETFHRDVIVGRDDSCGFQIIEPLVSRRHVKFEYLEGRWRIRDLGSANGTQVDGREIDAEWLQSGASIVLYPDGPVLTATIANPAVADQTQIAPSTT